MRRRSTLPVVLLLALGAVSACGNGAAKGTPASSTTTSGSATSSGTSGDVSSAAPSSPTDTSDSPSAAAGGSAGASGFPHDRTEATSLHKAVLGRSVARSAEEKAAVQAWMNYWQGAADTYYYYKPTQQFSDVATGAARSAVLTYMQQKKAEKRRVVGWARDNITSIDVTGNTAKIRDCTENYTFTVDEEAEPVTLPTPFYDATGTLTKVDGRWRVTTQDSRSLNKTCLS
jgi:hypothetical protein